MDKVELREGDKVLVKGTFVKRFDNGNVRISFAPEIEAREFPMFEINIPEDTLISFAESALKGKVVSPEQLHKWYLEATFELSPESYNPNAQKPYKELTNEQKFIDQYIADRINALSEKFGVTGGNNG
jgi:hypothetical protein